MKEEENVVLSGGFTDEMKAFIGDLYSKAVEVDNKTKEYANCFFKINLHETPMRVDDRQLLYIGFMLLPNIANYLVNILPQFMYPYVVAYLRDLSEMREDPVTINELYDYFQSIEIPL